MIQGLSPVRRALLVLVSAACVAVDTILARIVTQEVSSFVLVFFRNLFGFLLVPWLAGTGRVAFATQRMGLHVVRAALKILGLVCFFFGLSVVPVAEATAIAFATPLFAAVGAALSSARRSAMVGSRPSCWASGRADRAAARRRRAPRRCPGRAGLDREPRRDRAPGQAAGATTHPTPSSPSTSPSRCRWRYLRRSCSGPRPPCATLGLMALQGALGAASQFCSSERSGLPMPP